MNRSQAENILDAYVLLSTTSSKAASDSLREVILDAMTGYSNSSGITYPRITLPSMKPFTTVTTPNVIPNKAIVTCDTGGAQ